MIIVPVELMEVAETIRLHLVIISRPGQDRTGLNTCRPSWDRPSVSGVDVVDLYQLVLQLSPIGGTYLRIIRTQ